LLIISAAMRHLFLYQINEICRIYVHLNISFTIKFKSLNTRNQGNTLNETEKLLLISVLSRKLHKNVVTCARNVLLIWGHNVGKAVAGIHPAVDTAADIVNILRNQDMLEAALRNQDNRCRQAAVAEQSSCKDYRMLALAVGLRDMAYRCK
jgi:hypothetical protein